MIAVTLVTDGWVSVQVHIFEISYSNDGPHTGDPETGFLWGSSVSVSLAHDYPVPERVTTIRPSAAWAIDSVGKLTVNTNISTCNTLSLSRSIVALFIGYENIRCCSFEDISRRFRKKEVALFSETRVNMYQAIGRHHLGNPHL